MERKTDDYIVFCWKGEQITIPAKRVSLNNESKTDSFVSNDGANPDDIIKYIEYLLYKSMMEK